MDTKNKNFKKGLIIGIILGFGLPTCFVLWITRVNHRPRGMTNCSQTISCEECNSKGTVQCQYIDENNELLDITCPCKE